MSKFAVIPFDDVVLRSGELTFMEYRVLTYLYGRRNRKTGQCNPRKQQIADDLNIHRTHVWRVIRSLEKVGWLTERDESGNWGFGVPITTGKPTLPFTPPRGTRNVAKSATSKTPENVAESATNPIDADVAHSATRCSRIRNNTLQNVLHNDENTPYSLFLTEKEQRNNKEELGGAHNAIVDTPPIEVKKTKRGTRIPDPFILTAAMREYAATKRPNVDLIEETEKFVNYWRAKTGRDATKLDWTATWRNWILNARGTSNGTNSSNNRKERTDADVLRDSAEFIASKYSNSG